MKAERQHKECASRVLQPSKGGGGHIVDNRPAEITQRKLINDVSAVGILLIIDQQKLLNEN